VRAPAGLCGELERRLDGLSGARLERLISELDKVHDEDGVLAMLDRLA
jgi:hypothetical protein